MLSVNEVCEQKDTAWHLRGLNASCNVTSRNEESVSILTSQREIPAHQALDLQQN